MLSRRGRSRRAGEENAGSFRESRTIERDDKVTVHTEAGWFFLHPFSSAQANESGRMEEGSLHELLVTCLLALCSVWLD